MTRYYSEDDEDIDNSFANKPGIDENPPKREFEEYIESFFSYIHHTKCSLCNNKNPTLPIHLPFFREEIFICPDCLYVVYEQLAAFGYYEQILEQEIREGKVRERGGDFNPVEYINVPGESQNDFGHPTPLGEDNSETKDPLNSFSDDSFTKRDHHEDSEHSQEKLEQTIQQYLEMVGTTIIHHANELNLSIEESIVAVEVILETMKNVYNKL